MGFALKVIIETVFEFLVTIPALLVCCVWDTLVTNPELLLLVEGDEFFVAPLLFPPDDSVCPTSESDIWLQSIKEKNCNLELFQDKVGRDKSTDLT